MQNILFAFFVSFLAVFQSYAQTIVEPETCILNSIGKGSQPSGIDSNTIRFNCIKQFHRLAEPKAVFVNQSLLTQITLQWFPRLQVIGPPYYLNESVRINVKNNSLYRLIYIVVGISNKEKATTETYKFYADGTIEPFSVGYFNGSVISDSPINNMDEFSQKYTWGIVSVYGISK